MKRSPTATPPERRSVSLGVGCLVVLALAAYRPLLWGGAADFETMFFRPGALPPPVAVGMAGFALWCRRDRLRRATGAGAPWLAAALAGLGAAIYVWAHLTLTEPLLLPSLALEGLAAAAAWKGRAAVRIALLPAGLLLLGMALPRPLEDEAVWWLQRTSAIGGAWLLNLFGAPMHREGVILRGPDQSFHVIDGCSGLSGIAILTGVALVVRELFAGRGARSWLLVAVAPLLGLALNVVRVAVVAAAPGSAGTPEPGSDHTAQGLAVLMGGTLILYALGWTLCGDAAERRPPPPGQAPVPRRFWLPLAAVLAGLALISWTLPRFDEALPPRVPELNLPEQKAGWIGEPAPPEPHFTGVLRGGGHRRYWLERDGLRRPLRFVELLVGYEDPLAGESFRLLSSKLRVPGPTWDPVESRATRIWLLDHDAVLSLGAHGKERALSYTWRPRDRGLLRETLRAALGLDSSPLRRDRTRAAVRVVAYAPHDGQLVLDRVKQRLDLFIADFQEELGAL